MIKQDESATWLATALMAFIASCGYLIGLFMGHIAEVINGIYWLPVLFTSIYLVIAWWLNSRSQEDVKQFKGDIDTVRDMMAEVYSDDHEITIFSNGICGIDDPSGQCEIDFKDLDEMYEWSRIMRKELNESY